MALQVWLPLNGNLNNNGAATLTTNGTPSYVDGRTGKALSLASKVNFNGLPRLDNFTIMFWAKTDTCTVDWADLLGFTSKKADGANAADFRFEATQSSRACSWHNNSPYAISEGTQTMITNKGEWHHVCVSYDGAHIYSYTNGVLLSTQTGLGGYLSGSFHIGETGNITGGLSDLRIYDTCMTQAFISDMAKGLFMHYPLHPVWRPNIERYTNIGTGYYANTFGGYYQVTGSEQEWLGTRAYKVTMAVKDSTVTSKWKVIAHRGISFKNTLKPDTKYTISFDTNLKIWYNASIEATNGQNDITTVTGRDDAIITDCGDHYHYSYTVTTLPADNAGWTYDDHWIYLTMEEFIGKDLLITNLKLEEGEGDTPWIPHVNDTLYNTKLYTHAEEYDSAGFYGPIKLGGATPPTCSTESGIGATSYYFDGVGSIMYATNISLPKIWTLSIWFRPHNITETTQYLVSLNSGNSGSDGQELAIYINTTKIVYHAGGVKIEASKTLENGKWYHAVLTNDGTTQIGYLDGVRLGSATVGTAVGTNLTIGARSNKSTGAGDGAVYIFKGELTDMRVYAKAFTSDDVTRLYQRKGGVDNGHKWYAYEYIESLNNLVSAANNAIYGKKLGDGFGTYNQANCQVTFTDDGVRIYRPADIIHDSSTMHNMWGGIKLSPLLVDGQSLQKGHTYIILFDAKGKTSKAPKLSWTNNMGWGGGGLMPTPTAVSAQGFAADWQSENYTTLYYQWTIEDDVYKTCTSAYGSFEAGTVYPSYRDFEIGFQYQDTGSMGTDIYIRNVRCYDITGLVNAGVHSNGVLSTSALMEYGEKARIHHSAEIIGDSYIEI